MRVHVCSFSMSWIFLVLQQNYGFVGHTPCCNRSYQYFKRLPSNAAIPQSETEPPLPQKALQAVKACVIPVITAAVLSTGLLFAPPPALALNEAQQTVAEVWRTVDRLYLDRTFNGQDWFELRQSTMKAAAGGLDDAGRDKVNLQIRFSPGIHVICRLD